MLLEQFTKAEKDHCRRIHWAANKYSVLLNKYALAYDIKTSKFHKSTRSIYTYYPNIHGGISVIWYLFKTDNYIFLLANDGTKGEDLGLYYPSVGEAYPIARGCPRQGRFFDMPIQQIRNSPQDFYSYINSEEEPTVTILQGTCNHWGHVMAQEMPAYDDLPEENNYKALAAGKSYLNYRKFNSRLNINAQNLNDKNINDTIFQENLLVVRPTTRGFQFTSTHASELISEAKAETDSDFFASLNAKKISGRSIYAFDLRINQRVPLNQEDMFEIYVNLCSNHKASPPLFVVTGWSSKGKQFDTIEDSQTIQKELELFRNLKIRNPSFEVLPCIGLPLSEKILIQSLCEFHVSSWGSGLSYFWEIVRIPGIVHGNKHCLSRNQRPLISRSDESNLPLQSFLSADDIIDIDSRTGHTIQGDNNLLMRNNYRVKIDKFEEILNQSLKSMPL